MAHEGALRGGEALGGLGGLQIIGGLKGGGLAVWFEGVSPGEVLGGLEGLWVGRGFGR